jgi:hypothetical protein
MTFFWDVEPCSLVEIEIVLFCCNIFIFIYSIFSFHLISSICPFLSSFHIFYFAVCFHGSIPPPSARLRSRSPNSPIGSLALSAPTFSFFPSPIGPAKLPSCPACSYILNRFFARDLFIALIMEAVITFETSFFWTGKFLRDYTAQHPKRQSSSGNTVSN